MKKIKFFIQKRISYEFWPFWLFYIPFIPIWMYFSLKNKSLAYFTFVNPCMNFGGFTAYSKFDVLKNISKNYVPKTYLHTHQSEFIPLEFPFVAKPDVGERGKNVEIITNENDWKTYISKEKNDIIIQKFIKLPLEFGIFYAKFPNKNSGEILSITGKKFLHIHGNGKQTLQELIENNQRAYYRKKYLFEKYTNQRNEVIPKGKTLLLEPIGNHNRGTEFTDSSHLKTEKLREILDYITEEIGDFYYGRFDVKAASETDFQLGKFVILEVNGANSEATHIYDSKFTLWQAYKEVYRHLNVQQKIAFELKKNGNKKPTFTAILRIVVPKFLGL